MGCAFTIRVQDHILFFCQIPEGGNKKNIINELWESVKQPSTTKKSLLFTSKIEYKRVIPNYSCMYYIFLYVIRFMWMTFVSIATITNYHKLGGSNQQKCIILPFYKLEVQERSHWAKINVLAGGGVAFPYGCSRDKSVSLHFLVSRSTPTFLGFWPPSCIFKTTNVASLWPFSGSQISLCLCLPPPPILLNTLLMSQGPPK